MEGLELRVGFRVWDYRFLWDFEFGLPGLGLQDLGFGGFRVCE